MIAVTYNSIDCYRGTRRVFKTLEGARKFAQKWVGEAPEMGSYYAVSGDGVGKVTCEGCTLYDLFPKLALALSHPPTDRRGYRSYVDLQSDYPPPEADRDIEAREAGHGDPTIQGYQLADDTECPF